jgi:hypothetical protein
MRSLSFLLKGTKVSKCASGFSFVIMVFAPFRALVPVPVRPVVPVRAETALTTVEASSDPVNPAVVPVPADPDVDPDGFGPGLSSDSFGVTKK